MLKTQAQQENNHLLPLFCTAAPMEIHARRPTAKEDAWPEALPRSETQQHVYKQNPCAIVAVYVCLHLYKWKWYDDMTWYEHDLCQYTPYVVWSSSKISYRNISYLSVWQVISHIFCSGFMWKTHGNTEPLELLADNISSARKKFVTLFPEIRGLGCKDLGRKSSPRFPPKFFMGKKGEFDDLMTHS